MVIIQLVLLYATLLVYLLLSILIRIVDWPRQHQWKFAAIPYDLLDRNPESTKHLNNIL